MSAKPDPLLQLLLRIPVAPRLSVLGYHRVMAKQDPLRPGEPTAAEFEQRMRWVKANFTVLPLVDAVRALREDRLPKLALSITFDDGYADNHDVALPILQRLGLPATFFIASGYLDGGCMFNDLVIEAVRQAPDPHLELQDLGLGSHLARNDQERRQAIDGILARLKYFEPARRDAVAHEIAHRTRARIPADLMMTSQQVRALHGAGMAVGGHTVTHPILTNIAPEHAREEMAAGRACLERITGAPVPVFAYPNGKPLLDYRREHVALARELGFAAAVSSSNGAARPGDDPFQIPRFTPWDRWNWRFGLRLANNRRTRAYACA